MKKSRVILIYLLLAFVILIGCNNLNINNQDENKKNSDSAPLIQQNSNTLIPEEANSENDFESKIINILKEGTIISKSDNNIIYEDKDNMINTFKIDILESNKLFDIPVIEYIFDNQFIYYLVMSEDSSDKIQLCKSDLDGTSKQTILEEDYIRLIGIKDNWIYYIEGNGIVSNEGKVYKIKDDGTEKTWLEFSATNGKFVDSYLFYSKGKPLNALYAVNLDEMKHVRLSDGGGKIIEVIDEWVYYVDKFWKLGLFRVKIDGSQEMRLSDGIISDSIIKDKYIYYISNNNLYKCNLDGSNNTKLSENIPLTDNGKIKITFIDENIYYSYINKNADIDICKIKLE